MSYALMIDHRIYLRPPARGSDPYTLIDAMRDAYGCGGCRVLRAVPPDRPADLTDGDDGRWAVVVDHAGSSVEVIHRPTGRRLYRRAARHLR